VTSCEPGDGKSTVALNLAIVLTQLGRRVLLIDADLRRPRVHKTLRIGNDVGISSFLSGNAPLEELIQESEIPNLRVITSGPIPPNPSELLGSPGLQTLLEHFEQEDRFDHVIFDSPPVLSVTDAVILSTRADSTILVVRSGVTSREALAQSAARLRQSRARVSGAVLNAASHESGYYYGRYGRSYRYAYGAEDESAPRSRRSRKGATRRRAG
jgi:capsular exopolysaccharide synthesis family protein